MNRRKRIPPYTGMALICALALFGACKNPAGDDGRSVPVTGISLDRTSLDLAPAGTYPLAVTYTPANTTEKGLKWSTSNDSVATVSNGTVTAVSVGTATITATSTAHSTITASCIVTVTAPVPLTGISLPATLALNRGQQQTLTVTYTPADTTERELTWTTSDPAVATVSNGVVTAVGGGSAVITAASTVHSAITASCTVTVTLIYPTGISLPETFDIYRGRPVTLPVTYTPADTTERELAWTSSDPAVATVDPATGLITGVSAGTATITGTRGSLTASCVVTVKVVHPTAISLPPTFEISSGQEEKLDVTYTPTDTTETDLTWTSSNTGVATVDPATGLITGVSVGTATITATNGTLSASCVVTVTQSVNSVSISQSTLTLNINAAQQLTAEVSPAGANQGVNWSSSNESVATVSSAGVVTALKVGTATITAAAQGDPTKTDTCSVTVQTGPSGTPVSSISLYRSSGSSYLAPEQTFDLSVSVGPSNAANRGVTLSASPAGIVTLSETSAAHGDTITVTTVKAGTVTITATAQDGNGVSDSYQVTVLSATLSANVTGTVYPGNKVSVTAELLPAGTTSWSLQWSSDNPSVATVSGSGNYNHTAVITTVAPGTATITVSYNNLILGTYPITVSPVLVTSVTLDKSSLELSPGGTYQLKASVSPSNAADTSVTWSSGSESVATVSSSGQITAGSTPGTAIITATANDGSGKSASCTVTVKSGAGLVINFTGFEDETINLTTNSANDLSRRAYDRLTVTVGGSYTSIRWYVDGQQYWSSGYSQEVYGPNFSVSTHYLTVAVETSGGKYYSKELSFRVVE
jgi:uncharacterized protein YjdB